jgi:hypothetical protein
VAEDQVEAREDIGPVRFAFALPEPLPFPDQHAMFVLIPESPDIGVDLHFYQRKSRYGRTSGAFEAVHDVLRGLGEESRLENPNTRAPSIEYDYTVVIAHTVADWSRRESSEFPESDHPWDTPASVDPLNRCIRAVLYVSRAYRLAVTDSSPALSYERIPPTVLVSHWDNEKNAFGEFSLVLLLHHMNMPDPVAGELIQGDLLTRFDHFFYEQMIGTPLVSVRQRLADSRRALLWDGDYSLTVILAAVAAEVLIDTVLLLLLWEESTPPIVAAELLSQNEALTQRMKVLLVPRLRGQWNFKAGPIRDWLLHTVQVRGKVVHSNYEPTRIEAAAALDAAANLQKFLFDKLVTQRNVYPRSTLISVAQEGLARRGVWAGKIKRFFEVQGPAEPDWRQDFRTWSDELVSYRPTVGNTRGSRAGNVRRRHARISSHRSPRRPTQRLGRPRRPS